MKKLIPIILILSSCGGTKEKAAYNRPDQMVGVWSAKWETPADSYPDLTDTEFFMNGEFTFTNDSLKIENNGFPGCIFNVDTIAHTQSWYVSNDTLFLYNEPDVLGMSYIIKTQSESKIELQLMEDIFVTLSKENN
ncbi:MAG: hypothetical protein AB8B73_01995 [Ekhidna sp.]